MTNRWCDQLGRLAESRRVMGSFIPAGGASASWRPLRTWRSMAWSRARSPVEFAKLARVIFPVESGQMRTCKLVIFAALVWGFWRRASAIFVWTWPAYRSHLPPVFPPWPPPMRLPPPPRPLPELERPLPGPSPLMPVAKAVGGGLSAFFCASFGLSSATGACFSIFSGGGWTFGGGGGMTFGGGGGGGS